MFKWQRFENEYIITYMHVCCVLLYVKKGSDRGRDR